MQDGKDELVPRDPLSFTPWTEEKDCVWYKKMTVLPDSITLDWLHYGEVNISYCSLFPHK